MDQYPRCGVRGRARQAMVRGNSLGRQFGHHSVIIDSLVGVHAGVRRANRVMTVMTVMPRDREGRYVIIFCLGKPRGVRSMQDAQGASHGRGTVA